MCFVNIMKEKPSKCKTVQLRDSITMFTSIYRLSVEITAKKTGKIQNEGFEDKKRRGRLIVLNKVAKIVLKKVRYKRDNSAR